MTYIGPKGTVPSGSIKGLKEGEWYEIVISQQKQMVNNKKFHKVNYEKLMKRNKQFCRLVTFSRYL